MIFINAILFLLYGLIAFSVFIPIFLVSAWFLILLPVSIFFFLKTILRMQDLIKYVNFYNQIKVKGNDSTDSQDLKVKLLYMTINSYGYYYYHLQNKGYHEKDATMLSMAGAATKAKVSDQEFYESIEECNNGIIRLGNFSVNISLKPKHIGDYDFHVALVVQIFMWLLRQTSSPSIFFKENIIIEYEKIVRNSLLKTMKGEILNLDLLSKEDMKNGLIENAIALESNERLKGIIHERYDNLWNSLEKSKNTYL